jgi:hypothetical protein
VEDGAAAGVWVTLAALVNSAAIYVDRLLKAARLADISIEQEREFKLLITGPLSHLCP